MLSADPARARARQLPLAPRAAGRDRPLHRRA